MLPLVRDEAKEERWALAMAYVAIAGCAAWLALRLQPNILGDDAAITMRYAERIVAGHGFTYNDHERVLGASNPLYVLSLAAVASIGFDVESVVRGAGVVFLVVSALVAARLAERMSGSALGLLAGFLLPANEFFRYQIGSGMESGLAVCLGLVTVWHVLEGRTAWAGVFLGLAVWNKLDGLLLAAALIVSYATAARRFPLKIAAIAALVVTPWMAGAWIYFGSPIPHSLLVKLGQPPGAPSFNHLWVLQFLQGNPGWLVAAAAAASFGWWFQWSEGARVAAVTLGGWCLFHAAALTLLNFGDYFPWYLTVLVPPLVILACMLPGLLWRAPWPGWLRTSTAAIALAVLGFASTPLLRATAQDLAAHNAVKSWEAFDADRRLAGIFVRQYGDASEIVDSAYGWPAFEAANPINDRTGLNSMVLREPAAYVIVHGVPHDKGSSPPQGPEGYVPLATFTTARALTPGYSWFVVFGRPDSRIARTDFDNAVLDLGRLRNPKLIAAAQVSIER